MSFKVYYFDGYGRAEAIRFLLKYLDAEFEDHRLTGEEFGKLKAEGKFEFGQVPALEWDGKMYSQTNSILRAIGSNNGLYPAVTDPVTMWKIDSLIDAQEDIGNQFWKSSNTGDEETKKKALETFFGQTLPQYFGRLEKRLKENTSQKYIVGDKITIADFAIASVAYTRIFNEANPGSK